VSHPDDDQLVQLVDLVLGSGDEVSAELRDHVNDCPVCASTVNDLRRTLTLTAATGGPNSWSHPPESLWSRITDTIDAQSATPAIPGRGTATPETATTDRDNADAADVEKPAPPAAGRTTDPTAGPTQGTVTSLEAGSARRTRRRVVSWAAGMAAAGLAVGLLSGRALWNDPAPVVATVAQTQLDTLDTNQRLGEASVVRTSQGVDLKVATSQPFDAAGGFIEVWLINKDGKRMVSVGVLRGASPETFPISQDLINQGYVIVDISREGFDNKPQHSGDSLARGTLRI